MTIPRGLSNCPPGLEYLSRIDHLLVHQTLELVEFIAGIELNNKYSVMNSLGEKVYYAVEINDYCTRMCIGPSRPFDMEILDNFGQEVIHLNRAMTCWGCSWFQFMEVTAPPGIVIGSIKEEYSFWNPTYAIKNALGEVVLKIKGPVCTFSLPGEDVEFQILSVHDETQVGAIKKHWSGLAREIFTDVNIFGISFPMELDVKIKAVLLGACFLIDFIHFEKRK